MRLINVVTVWAQCHFFKKKKKKSLLHTWPPGSSRRSEWCREWASSHTRSTSANGVCSTLRHVGESLRPSGFQHLEQNQGQYDRTHIFHIFHGQINSLHFWKSSALICNHLLVFIASCFHIFEADSRCRNSQMCIWFIRFNEWLKILGLNKLCLLIKLKEQLYFPWTIWAANCYNCNPLDRM